MRQKPGIIITTAFAKEWFDYKDGKLFWKKPPRQGVPAGKEAGTTKSHGYRLTCFRGEYLYIHRLVWAWHGNIVDENVRLDHIDRDSLNNHIENLRPLTHQQNMWNCKNTRGGYQNKAGRYVAQIIYDGKAHYLGAYDTEEEAHQAYLEAKAIHHQ